MERLAKVIAQRGYCSRRKAETLIKAGRVFVNGEQVKEFPALVNTNDEILIDGHWLENEAKEYYLLNKPRGVITSVSDEKGRKTVTELIPSEKRLYPVGRLDYYTTGLILITNDGELANLLMQPHNEIEKTYVVKINGQLTNKERKALRDGVIVDGYLTRPAKLKKVKYDKKTDTTIFTLVIHEGKNRQVRKMVEALGKKVLKLKREGIAFLTVENLPPGHYRPLTIKEVKKLYSLQKNNIN